MSLAFDGLRIFSSFCQPVRLTSPLAVSQSAPEALLPNGSNKDRPAIKRIFMSGLSDKEGVGSALHLYCKLLLYEKWCGFEKNARSSRFSQPSVRVVEAQVH